MNQQQWLKLGKILSPHGIKGWVNFLPYVDDTFQWDDITEVCVSQKDRLVEYELLRVWQQKKTRLVLKGIEDRNAAEALLNQEVLIDKSNLPGLGEGDYYEYQLIGTQVRLTDGQILGQVASVMEAGASQILVVATSEGEALIPINAENIATMSIQEIIVHPIPGLLELNR